MSRANSSDRIAGVYAILCEATGHVYIGGSADLPGRYAHHFARLRLGKHTNRRLQQLYNAHGEESLSWVTLEPMRVTWHPEFPQYGNLGPIGAAERRWVADIRAEVGELLLNAEDSGAGGCVSYSLPINRRQQRMFWPPLPKGGPPRSRKKRREPRESSDRLAIG